MRGYDPFLSFDLVLEDSRGRRRTAVLRPHASTLVWKDTGLSINLTPLLGHGYQRRVMEFKPHPTTSPSEPGRKDQKLKTIKIQLGLKCNYTCLYCNQASTPHEIQGNHEDAMKFLQEFPKIFDAGPNGDGDGRRLEFWGGEPFVYWKILEWMVPALRQSYPKAHFNIITNGSLLDEEKIQWLIDNDMGVNISHDGPGHKETRGPDPFDDPVASKWIKELYRRMGPKSDIGKKYGHSRVGFGCVLTRRNYSLAAIRRFIADRLGVPDDELNLTTEDIVLPYDEGGMKAGPQNDEEYQAFINQQFFEATSGSSLPVHAVGGKIKEFARQLANGIPVFVHGQKCGMDRPDTMATNLKGQVTTCHNLSAGTKHEIGNIASVEEVRLDTAYHFSAREECMQCPVVQLCKGACMFLEDDLWRRACDNSWAWNVSILASAMFYLTKMTLVQIDGKVIRRESLPSTQPVVTLPPIRAKAYMR